MSPLDNGKVKRKKAKPFKRREVAMMKALAAEGLTLTEASARMGRLVPTLGAQAVKHGVKFTFGGVAQKVRREDVPTIVAAYRAGEILDAIGRRYGVTRERIRQILSSAGIKATDGGASVTSRRNRIKRAASRDATSLARWGCTWAQHKWLLQIGHEMKEAGRGYGQTPTGAFKHQQLNAHKRGINWEFTLWQWWTIWQASGHWEDRGRGQGYVMARFGDSGPYAEDNVEIVRAAVNSSITKNKKTDLPVGVRRAKTKAEQYEAHRQINNQKLKLGRYPTPELASAAYRAASVK